MRVLLTVDPEIPVPPKHYGGIERIVDELVCGLSSMGHSVGLIAHPDSTSPAERRFVWPSATSDRPIDLIRNTMTLARAIRQFRADLVHSFSSVFYLTPLLPMRLPKVSSFQRAPSRRAVKWGAALSNGTLRFTGCSDHISASGRAIAGVWTTIHNFVGLEKYTFRPQVADDAPLVFLSRVERIKGTHTAVAVARRTGRRLLIAGNCHEHDPFFHLEIAPYLGKDGIEYLGPVDDVQKNELLGQAAAMIVPIEWEEPFGIVFAESLACGTPVISCPRGALPEIVRQGIDGYLVEDIDGACAAVENLARLNRHDCRQRVEEHFSSTVVIKRYEQLYETLIAQALK